MKMLKEIQNLSKKTRVRNGVMNILNLYLIVSGFLIVLSHDISRLTATWIITIGIDLFSLLICNILLISCFLENEDTKQQKYLTYLITVISLGLFFDLCCWVFDGMSEHAFMVKFSNTAFYIFNNIMTVIFWEYIKEEMKMTDHKVSKRSSVIHGICLAEIFAILLNWGLGFFFTVSKDGVYHRTDYYILSMIPAAASFAIIIYSIYKHGMTARDRAIVLSYISFPMFGVGFQSAVYGLSIMIPCTLLAMILIYNNIHLTRKKVLAETEVDLQKKNVALMVSQIQPHFLYNTLTTISNLCRKDPEEAEEVTVMFSQYLRANLDSLKKTEPVPFMMELQHVKIYLELEKKRFKDKVNFEFDIKEQNFLVPSLGLQPIAENCVKHGICEKDEPGTIKISSEKCEEGVKVIIEDDGVGFDPSVPKKDDGRTHVGMSNVKDRLYEMCNATMTVESSPGNGCKTTIIFPQKR